MTLPYIPLDRMTDEDRIARHANIVRGCLRVVRRRRYRSCRSWLAMMERHTEALERYLAGKRY